MRQYFKEILHLLGSDRRKVPGLIVLFIGISLLDLIGLGLVGPFITLLVDSSPLNSKLGQFAGALGLPVERRPLLTILGLALFVTFLLKAGSAIVMNYVIIRFSQNQQVRLRSILMHAYQMLPYTEHLNRNSSEYVYSISNLTAQFSGNVVLNLLRTTSDGIVAFFVLILLAWTNAPILALLIVLLGGVLFIYDRLFRRSLREYGKKLNLASTSMMQGIREGIEGLKEIRILRKEAYFLHKVRSGAKQVAKFQVRERIILVLPRYFLELMMIIFLILLVFGIQFLDKNLDALLPDLSVFGVAALRLMPIANVISSSLAGIRYSRDSVSRLYRDLSDIEYSRIEEFPEEARTDQEPFNSLELNRICFRYPNARQGALNDVSLKIRTNESVGFVGLSGSGKTTLVDVLLGLLDPQEGEIDYNSRPLKENLLAWRSQTAYLPQDVFLIDSTLRHNIALGIGSDEIDDARLRKAIRQASLAELAEQLPQGMNTIIGERGARLSGGQRQRVALARAFYHGRSVLVMDEATSALDDETEREVINEIERLKGHVTIIVIAHRLTTLQHCDRIYRIDHGRIIETFSPDSLA